MYKDILEEKAFAFYNNHIWKRKNHQGTLEEQAARYSFLPASRRALKYINKKQAPDLRKTGEKLLVDFLTKKDFKDDTCFALMNTLRDLYRDAGEIYWTYGNSQKWVNMAIKYYRTLCLYNNIYDIEYCLQNQNYNLFPVDRIITDIIHEDFNLDFPFSWSRCDDINIFKAYWKDVEKRCLPKNLSPCSYEMIAWRK